MVNLSPKLLRNLKQYYEQIALMHEEEMSYNYMIERLNIPQEDLLDMTDVIFDRNPIYKATNLFGETLCYQLNANTGQSREIENVNEY